MADKGSLYRLNDVTHVASGINEELFGELLPPDKVKQFTVHFTWFHERFRVLPVDGSEDIVHIYARTYIMMLLSTQLFGDKSTNRIHIRWLSFVARLENMGTYS
ncbi:hypothetical protein Ahy_A01g003327 [Arachis hypogaea]|uniref:Aminotransferase-like plant mobile domain-containing protein n=1 Tax=Arachis hypogaea TaxID=3818 RepID=A0A445ESY1_ARAHY|nr:hypothetical protein Ahy_A01g003327 [Arachis hypogaea]